MKTYKASDNSIHCIDPQFAYMLPIGCVEITEEEADALRAAAQANDPAPASVLVDPVDKLKSFLSANPDVAALLGA